ncbi:hypothetical protein QBZ16_000647 [Prototheca wickerhamii]|uniref:Glutamate dehydrogenase n=1 Tax=Prototheca wickerhamii TaxID=3111 RepID=A0AAD9MN64_PROWI|nr:hypothetical protein QBZ16_000647 [Prototheca wickerhamii]
MHVAASQSQGSGKEDDERLQELLSGIDDGELQAILRDVYRRDYEQEEFLQAVKGITVSIMPVLQKFPQYKTAYRLLLEPERQILFRVPWVDDAGRWRCNRGYRVQFSSALGPYKGGLRFHPSVNLSIVKFLGFEQIFKNALTTLPMGGAKGGADFDPKACSDREIMAFCQSFMTELYRHIGADTDIPAGDIGVGPREVGFLYGQYKRITRDRGGTLTGKGHTWGGSEIRPEATGGKRCVVSGAGNVAQFCVEMLLEKEAIVLTMSDSQGTIFAKEGLSRKTLKKAGRRGLGGQLSELEEEGVEYREGSKPWTLDDLGEVFAAFPCATQNELDGEGARALVKAGVKLVMEGANMPTTAEAADALHKADAKLVTGKAANAGGVAVSGLEMAQNRGLIPWSRQQVLDKLEGIMESIYEETTSAAKEYDTTLVDGANIASFIRVAEAVLEQGTV